MALSIKLKLPTCVQPEVMPRPGQIGRYTNKIHHLRKHLLKKLRKQSFAKPFMQPVDTVALNVPTYYTVVKEPMDIGTIISRVDNLYYSSVEELTDDLFLVIGNCYIFNRPEAMVYQNGKKLEKLVFKSYRNMPQGEEVPYSTKKSEKSIVKQECMQRLKELHNNTETLEPTERDFFQKKWLALSDKVHERQFKTLETFQAEVGNTLGQCHNQMMHILGSFQQEYKRSLKSDIFNAQCDKSKFKWEDNLIAALDATLDSLKVSQSGDLAEVKGSSRELLMQMLVNSQIISEGLCLQTFLLDSSDDENLEPRPNVVGEKERLDIQTQFDQLSSQSMYEIMHIIEQIESCTNIDNKRNYDVMNFNIETISLIKKAIDRAMRDQSKANEKKNLQLNLGMNLDSIFQKFGSKSFESSETQRINQSDHSGASEEIMNEESGDDEMESAGEVWDENADKEIEEDACEYSNEESFEELDEECDEEYDEEYDEEMEEESLDENRNDDDDESCAEDSNEYYSEVSDVSGKIPAKILVANSQNGLEEVSGEEMKVGSSASNGEESGEEFEEEDGESCADGSNEYYIEDSDVSGKVPDKIFEANNKNDLEDVSGEEVDVGSDALSGEESEEELEEDDYESCAEDSNEYYSEDSDVSGKIPPKILDANCQNGLEDVSGEEMDVDTDAASGEDSKDDFEEDTGDADDYEELSAEESDENCTENVSVHSDDKNDGESSFEDFEEECEEECDEEFEVESGVDDLGESSGEDLEEKDSDKNLSVQLKIEDGETSEEEFVENCSDNSNAQIFTDGLEEEDCNRNLRVQLNSEDGETSGKKFVENCTENANAQSFTGGLEEEDCNKNLCVQLDSENGETSGEEFVENCTENANAQSFTGGLEEEDCNKNLRVQLNSEDGETSWEEFVENCTENANAQSFTGGLEEENCNKNLSIQLDSEDGETSGEEFVEKCIKNVNAQIKAEEEEECSEEEEECIEEEECSEEEEECSQEEDECGEEVEEYSEEEECSEEEEECSEEEEECSEEEEECSEEEEECSEEEVCEENMNIETDTNDGDEVSVRPDVNNIIGSCDEEMEEDCDNNLNKNNIDLNIHCKVDDEKNSVEVIDENFTEDSEEDSEMDDGSDDSNAYEKVDNMDSDTINKGDSNLNVQQNVENSNEQDVSLVTNLENNLVVKRL